MDSNKPGNGSSDPDPRETSRSDQHGSCFDSESIESDKSDFIESPVETKYDGSIDWESRAVNHGAGDSAEPLEEETTDCYNLHKPIAPDVSMVNKDRYLAAAEIPLTHFEAVGAYIELRHGENTTESRYGFKKGRQHHAKHQYMRGMAIDRQLLNSYSNPTTVLLSLRISPTVDGRLTMLTTLAEAVGKTIDQLRYRLQNAPDAPFESDEWEYTGVYAGTDERATPHFHLLIYIDGNVSKSLFDPVIDTFVDACELAPDDGRGNRSDEGAVEIRGNGDEPIPYADDEALRSDNIYEGQNSQGAVYVLTQLPHHGEVDEMARDELLHSATVDAWGGRPFRSSLSMLDIDEQYFPSAPM